MLKNFKTYMETEANLTQAEVDRVCALCKVRKLRRRQLWLREGDVCVHKLFIVNGLLKTYRLSDSGEEHILRFSPENTWLVELESFVNGTPSKYNIEVLEDSEVVVWTR